MTQNSSIYPMNALQWETYEEWNQDREMTEYNTTVAMDALRENISADRMAQACQHVLDSQRYLHAHLTEQEGEILKHDFVKHINLISQKLQAIPQYETERIDTAKERIHRYFAETAIKEIDPNRFEQELIYYLEKLDITEEKIRLAKHIAYFVDTMDNEESCGKKLGFVAQEMGREINTTGSKANHVEIQKIVVEMKDELEKIKEQLGNIL